MLPIVTRSADCKDCYRCLRVCPVKAISVNNGQAKVNEDKCILCGKCVLECPQQAKLIRSEVYKVKDFLDTKKKVVLSIAPSFPAYFDKKSYPELIKKLYKIGFYCIEETSVGAKYTAEAYKELYEQSDKPVISSCCPVIVNLVEIYFPELINNLAPVASPMIAHGLSFKERFGWDTKVVFAGPCIAKITERGMEGKVDAVLTFSQLEDLINQSQNEVSDPIFSDKNYYLDTRLFPLPGGSIRTFIGDQHLLNTEVETITGIDDCWKTLQSIKEGKIKLKFLELLACRGGCINGPVINHRKSLVEKRCNVIEYYRQFSDFPSLDLFPVTKNLLHRRFINRAYFEEKPSEEIIRQILAQIGKYSKEDEKNCGGCGYSTCREKAQAVFNGYAELEMCVSYMKAKAESTAHTIVNSTPNGLIVFDKNLKIIELNNAAKKMFDLFALEVGDNLAEYMDIWHFQKVIKTSKSIKDVSYYYPELELHTRQIVVPMENTKDNLYMAIITDITEDVKKRKEIEEIQKQIITKAHQVIDNQMMVAQQIAGLLGETTAETKTTLHELIKYLNNETEREI